MTALQKASLAAALVASVGFTADSAAGSATANLTLNVDVSQNCTINGIAATFPYDAYVANATTPFTATFDITYACTQGTSPTITLNEGVNPLVGSTPVAPNRRMVNGTNFLSYNLFATTANQGTGSVGVAWGTNPAMSPVLVAGEGLLIAKTVPAYLTIFPGQLAPTQDIVFFPTVFELKPGQQRGVRLGTTAKFGAEEKTYRIFIDELTSSADASPAGTISFQLRSRVGLPIFLDPQASTATARIDSLALSRSLLSLRLHSTGSAHLKLQHVRVTALGDSASVYQHSFPVSYLLAGGELRLSAEVPLDRCRLTRAIEVEVQTDAGVLRDRLELPASTSRCAG